MGGKKPAKKGTRPREAAVALDKVWQSRGKNERLWKGCNNLRKPPKLFGRRSRCCCWLGSLSSSCCVRGAAKCIHCTFAATFGQKGRTTHRNPNVSERLILLPRCTLCDVCCCVVVACRQVSSSCLPACLPACLPGSFHRRHR